MHVSASIATGAYQRPELVTQISGTPAVAKEEDRPQDRGAESLGCFKGMFVAFVMEATGALCLFLIWQIGHHVQ